jgi:hypothetical protein
MTEARLYAFGYCDVYRGKYQRLRGGAYLFKSMGSSSAPEAVSAQDSLLDLPFFYF